MNKQNTKKLLETYPKIFSRYNLPPTQTAMCWGFDCGDGWFWLIDNLCHSIQTYVDSRNEGIRIRKKAKLSMNEEEWQVEASQVKEKFGGLRFYINGGNDYIQGMIWLAEDMSKRICERCGGTKNVQQTTTGWISSLCPKCMSRKANESRGRRRKDR